MHAMLNRFTAIITIPFVFWFSGNFWHELIGKTNLSIESKQDLFGMALGLTMVGWIAVFGYLRDTSCHAEHPLPGE